MREGARYRPILCTLHTAPASQLMGYMTDGLNERRRRQSETVTIECTLHTHSPAARSEPQVIDFVVGRMRADLGLVPWGIRAVLRGRLGRRRKQTDERSSRSSSLTSDLSPYSPYSPSRPILPSWSAAEAYGRILQRLPKLVSIPY